METVAARINARLCMVPVQDQSWKIGQEWGVWNMNLIRQCGFVEVVERVAK